LARSFRPSVRSSPSVTPGNGALSDEGPLELGQGCEDPEDELPRRGRGVDRCSLAREHFEPHATVCDVMDRVDQVAQVSTESVEFPYQESIALPERLQARRQVRAVILHFERAH